MNQCTKIAYPSKKVANRRRKAIERKHCRELIAYHCPHCGKWHLAGKDKAVFRALDRLRAPKNNT